MGLMHTPWIGALVVLAALGLTVLSGRLDRLDQLEQHPLSERKLAATRA